MINLRFRLINTLTVLVNLLYAQWVFGDGDRPWTLHVNDNTSAGADGTKLADLDGDGREDIVVMWSSWKPKMRLRDRVLE